MLWETLQIASKLTSDNLRQLPTCWFSCILERNYVIKGKSTSPPDPSCHVPKSQHEFHARGIDPLSAICLLLGWDEATGAWNILLKIKGPSGSLQIFMPGCFQRDINRSEVNANNCGGTWCNHCCHLLLKFT